MATRTSYDEGMSQERQRSGLIELGKEILSLLDAARPRIEEMWEAAAPVAEALATFPKRLESSLLVMADYGWFLVASMPPTSAFEVAHTLSEQRIADADALMCQHAEQDLDFVLAELARAFPHRERIVCKALKAHSDGDYELSVPVLLAQADGMAKDKLRTGLYDKERDSRNTPARPKLRTPIENALDKLPWHEKVVYASVVEPLRHLWPLSASAGQFPTDRPVLNRHAVLHGESTDYAVKKVSCQAVCVASYVALALDALTQTVSARSIPHSSR